MLTREQEFYLRYILLLLDGGTTLLRALVDKALNSLGVTFAEFLQTNEPTIRDDETLNQDQISVLYSMFPEEAQNDECDISILAKLISNYLHTHLSHTEISAVHEVNDTRLLYLRQRQFSMELLEFHNQANILVECIHSGYSDLGQEEKDTLDNIIVTAKTCPLDMTLVTRIEFLDKQRAFIPAIQEILAEIRESQTQSTGAVTSAPDKEYNSASTESVARRPVVIYSGNEASVNETDVGTLDQATAEKEKQDKEYNSASTESDVRPRDVIHSGNEASENETDVGTVDQTTAEREQLVPDTEYHSDNTESDVRCPEVIYSRNEASGNETNVGTVAQATAEIEKQADASIDVAAGVPGDMEANNWTLKGEAEEIRGHVEKYGLANIQDVLQRTMDHWKEKPLNIAITGASGKGKSSLVNALRTMDPNDKDAAPVDEEECTVDCQPYPHPEHSSIMFWDVPGVGTLNFPKETYLQQINIDQYDFVVIVSSERFSETDFWLAKEIKVRDKRFYFVCTKIDVDMNNRRLRHDGKFDENEEFKELKDRKRATLVKNFGTNDFHLFLISNNHPGKYDFPDLLRQLIIDAPKEMKMTLALGLAGMSESLLEEKVSALSSRIWKCALASAAGSIIPIPGVSYFLDISLILEELLFYRRQLALDDKSLEHLAHMANKSLPELKESVDFITPESLFTFGGLTKYLSKYLAGKVAKKIAQYTLPVIGTTVNCCSSFACTKEILREILQMMKTDAISVLRYVTNRDSSL